MDVSIIIVNYNTKDYLINCINSIYTYTKDIDFEIIVSDNNSTDGSNIEINNLFPKIKYIYNEKNLGFGAANNIGLKAAKGKYIFYLNSDTLLNNNAIKIFYDYWENNSDNSLGALGCNLIDENKFYTTSFNKFPSYTLIKKDYIGDLKQLTKRTLFFFISNNFSFKKNKSTKKNIEPFFGEVDYISGADLFMLNDNNAIFDEDFFLYSEDADINKRLENQGKKRIIIEGPSIQHLEHKSNKTVSKILYFGSISKINFSLSAILFLRKHDNNINQIRKLKFLLTIIWLNPFIFKNTKKYLLKMWKI